MSNSIKNSKNYSGIIIEMFGAPGIGKTYLVKNLANCFYNDGISFSDRCLSVGQMPKFKRIIHKIRIISQVIFYQPGIISYFSGFVFRAGVRKPKDFIKVVFNWIYLTALVRCEITKKGLVILDQGFAQALWSTVFRGQLVEIKNATKLYHFFLEACTARQLIIVKISLDEQSHYLQLESRKYGNSPIDGRGNEQFDKSLRITRSVGDIIDEIVKVSNIHIINFKNEKFCKGIILYKQLLEIIKTN